MCEWRLYILRRDIHQLDFLSPILIQSRIILGFSVTSLAHLEMGYSKY